ncbi:MAG: hypothetical protein IT452_22380 [Planctomycetia bacterium]|nr:hypothetical protein [Planctomycetia bacterium]
MSGPASPTLPRLVGASLAVAAFVAILVWSLGVGIEMSGAMVRAVGGSACMFFVGLILGRAIGDSVAGPEQGAKDGEKKQEIRKKPLT